MNAIKLLILTDKETAEKIVSILENIDIKNISLQNTSTVKEMQKIHNLNFYGHGQWANTLKELFHRKDCKLNLVISRFPNGDKDIELFCNVNGITYLTVENINDYLK